MMNNHILGSKVPKNPYFVIVFYFIHCGVLWCVLWCPPVSCGVSCGVLWFSDIPGVQVSRDQGV